MTRVASFHLASFPLRRTVSKALSIPAERWELSEAEGFVFGKVLATSAKNTTRFSADLGRWAIFAVWEDETARKNFLESSPLVERWTKSAKSFRHLFLEPIAAHGTWDGLDLFGDTHTKPQDFESIAVLTRATIRPSKTFAFARAIGAVDDVLKSHSGCTLALGIGEWPVVHQATFSVWDSADSIRAFAYDKGQHADVIKRRHDENWFNEELFARFAVSAEFGTASP